MSTTMEYEEQVVPPATAKPKAPRGLIIYLMATVLLTAMGMTIIAPVSPFIVQQYVGEADLASALGWITAIYAVCQFVAAPALGVLSDRFGRRPLLLICLLGSAVGYLLFGIGGSLAMLFLGRIIDGITGGNISILMAYLGDITSDEDRGKLFGQIGATVGVGFIVGPVLGGFAANFGYTVPLYIAAALTLINFVWGYFGMPESLRPEHRSEKTSAADFNPVRQLRKVFMLPGLRWLLTLGLLYTFPFALFTTVMSVLAKDALNWGPDTIGLVFLLVGATDIVMQGFVFGKLQPLLGERKLVVAGLVAEMISYILVGSIAFIHSPWPLIVGVVLFSVGSGLFEPAAGSLVAGAAGPRNQGVVQGGNAALRSLTNIAGPLLAGWLYTQLGGASPYFIGAALLVVGIVVALIGIPAHQRPATAPEAQLGMAE